MKAKITKILICLLITLAMLLAACSSTNADGENAIGAQGENPGMSDASDMAGSTEEIKEVLSAESYRRVIPAFYEASLSYAHFFTRSREVI